MCKAFVSACADGNLVTAKRLISSGIINTKAINDAFDESIRMENLDVADWLIAISYLPDFRLFTPEKNLKNANRRTDEISNWIDDTMSHLELANGRRFYLGFSANKLYLPIHFFDHLFVSVDYVNQNDQKYDTELNKINNLTSEDYIIGEFEIIDQVNIDTYLIHNSQLLEIELPLLDPNFKMKRLDYEIYNENKILRTVTKWRVNKMKIVSVREMHDEETFNFLDTIGITFRNYSGGITSIEFGIHKNISGYKWLIRNRLIASDYRLILDAAFINYMPDDDLPLIKKAIKICSNNGILNFAYVENLNPVKIQVLIELIAENQITIVNIN